MTLPNKPLFLGVALDERADWRHYFRRPEAAANIKDAAKQQADIAKKEAKLEARAATAPVSATITHAILLDAWARPVFETQQQSGRPVGEASVQLAAFLSTLLHSDTPVTAPAGVVPLYGLCVRDRLRVMALDVMRYQAAGAGEALLHPETWYHRPFTPSPWCDPYEAIIQSDMRGDVDVYGLCEFLGVSGEIPADILKDPFTQADIARQLAIRGALIPADAGMLVARPVAT